MDWFGRLEEYDERDEQFPMRAVIPLESGRTWRYWWPSGLWHNQGATPRCVEYAWWHKILDGPQTKRIADHPDDVPWPTPRLYCAAQKRDAWDGDCDHHLYDGTSVRAGAKVLRDAGVIDEYRWAGNVDDILLCILEVGPVLIGSRWTNGMLQPDDDGIIAPSGESVGGHAYVMNGVNLDTGFLRIKNSWGRQWGNKGFAYIKIEEFRDLFNEGAEACLPVEKE